jgi:hypothetical protein
MDNTNNTDGAAGEPSGAAGPGEPSAGRRATPRAGRVQRQVARRHRRDRIAGILIALLGVAVLIVAFLALRNPRHSATAAGSDTHEVTAPARSSQVTRHPSSAASTPQSSASSQTSSAPTAIGSKPLIVLNQTTTTGLADQAAARFRSGGWQVTSAQDGYQNDVITTTAYYDPAIAGAQRAAQALARQFPTIHRVAEKFPELPAGPVVVVLTTDYTSG